MKQISIAAIDRWLDRSTSEDYLTNPLAMDWARIVKIGEEFGEVVEQFILTTGQNPRKGHTRDINPVLEELADVVVTALCAIQHFTKDASETDAIVNRKIDYVYNRMREHQERQLNG